MTDKELQRSVAERLRWDAKIDPDAIAVDAHDGVVTLRGTVTSSREMNEAKAAAERVYDVVSVHNELEVRILDDDARRDDAGLRGAVLQALMLDSLVPSTVDATVQDGYVTLLGSAEWQYQRDAAKFVAANVAGAVGLEDQIALHAPASGADDIKRSIENALARNAKLDAAGVAVESSNGKVTLTGVVRSWAEHDEVIDAAWAASGVQEVNDKLVVS